jgi:hypothetical protein
MSHHSTRSSAISRRTRSRTHPQIAVQPPAPIRVRRGVRFRTRPTTQLEQTHRSHRSAWLSEEEGALPHPTNPTLSSIYEEPAQEVTSLPSLSEEPFQFESSTPSSNQEVSSVSVSSPQPTYDLRANSESSLLPSYQATSTVDPSVGDLGGFSWEHRSETELQHPPQAEELRDMR